MNNIQMVFPSANIAYKKTFSDRNKRTYNYNKSS